MQIEDFKPWQWVVLGLLAGLAFSLVLLVAGPSFATAELDTVDASTFEHALLGRLVAGGEQRFLPESQKGKPLVKDVIVHPPFHGGEGQYWVTGMLYSVRPVLKDPSNAKGGTQLFDQWKPFKYLTKAPYKGQNGVAGVPGNYPTVVGYLAALKAKDKSAVFDYRYAWQETAAGLWTLPPLAGLLMVGIAWPLSLRAMQSFGMARAPKVVKKPAPVPEPAPVVKPVTGVRLAPPPPPPPAPKPTRDPDDKEYGGEFYPVVKATQHE